jgi:hypothetical protein
VGRSAARAPAAFAAAVEPKYIVSVMANRPELLSNARDPVDLAVNRHDGVSSPGSSPTA